MLVVSYGETDLCQVPTYVFDLAAFHELLNLSTYYSNLGIDGKGGILSKEDACLMFIASGILREAVFTHIGVLQNLPGSIVCDIVHMMSQGYREVLNGQLLDCNCLPKLADVDGMPYESYLEQYLLRCGLLGGSSLRSACMTGGLAGNLDNSQLEALSRYGWFHGMSMQIINDISDYVPISAADRSAGKNTNDIYSDLNNQKSTLPLYCAYRYGSRSEKDFLTAWTSNCSPNEERLMSILKAARAFDFAVSICQAADSLASNAIEGLGDIRVSYLKAALNTSKCNRFFRYLEDDIGIDLHAMTIDPKTKHLLDRSYQKIATKYYD